MTRGIAAVSTSRPARKTAKNLAVAAAIVTALASPLAATAASNTSPLITIPPATLPPPPLPAPPSAESPASAPRESLSAELHVVRYSEGTGVAMYGALAETTGSASETLLALIAHAKAFDPAPVSQLVLADETDRHAQALFTATAHGGPVIGVAAVALSNSGGDASLLYDSAEAFPASFPRLQQTLASNPAVEIGVSDNSVTQAGSESGGHADVHWDEAIAALVKGGEAPIDAGLAHSLADRLASDTGEMWRIVSPPALH